MGDCTKCQFAHQGDIDPNNIGAPRPYVCKRFPPTAVVMQSGQGVAVVSVWPPVQTGNACAEFKLKDKPQ